jgi:tRNA dimethylallyltransferase
MNGSPASENEKWSPGGPFSGQRCPVIVGPTAVGKTGLVTALIERLPIEVISLDSRQIYRGLRIGTAQPTAEEMATCPHHLIDFISPAEKYDAIRFRNDFERTYSEIVDRGCHPVLVGGAGMYLTALREGFMEIPGSSPERLVEVRADLDQLDDANIRSRLEKADPESFRRIHSNDRYRSQRALEIFELSGRTMTDLKAVQQPAPALGLEFPTIVLERPVDELNERIARRTELMLDEGLVQETEDALGEFPPDCAGLMSIGYRETVQFLGGEMDREELVTRIVLTTRQYAKRQRTWFRHVPRVFSGDPSDRKLYAALVQILD